LLLPALSQDAVYDHTGGKKGAHLVASALLSDGMVMPLAGSFLALSRSAVDGISTKQLIVPRISRVEDSLIH